MSLIVQFFYVDQLSIIMIGLISFISITVAKFSFHYLAGDRKQNTFYFNLIMITITILLMVNVDHILIFLILWITSNFFLTKLMLHKKEWEAAKQSFFLARKNFLLGGLFLTSAFIILFNATKKFSIQFIINHNLEPTTAIIAGFLIFLAAMTQSSLWPCHKWLISSLNSPTPVSAFMHAGLVNGGGFLLARFAPILARHSILLHLLFFSGIFTALIGTLWKLMQSDIKRMLACSTMGQMGFMVAQCGLGLFPAAISHLCWHGLFKAYLFLASGSTAQEKRLDLNYPPLFKHFLMAISCGTISAYVFVIICQKNILTNDTTIFINFLIMITGTQFTLPVIRSQSIFNLLLSITMALALGFFYGYSIKLMEIFLAPLDILFIQPLNILHILTLILLLASWLAILFINTKKQKQYPDWLIKIYVYMINTSQPHPDTITKHRNHYQF